MFNWFLKRKAAAQDDVPSELAARKTAPRTKRVIEMFDTSASLYSGKIKKVYVDTRDINENGVASLKTPPFSHREEYEIGRDLFYTASEAKAAVDKKRDEELRRLEKRLVELKGFTFPLSLYHL